MDNINSAYPVPSASPSPSPSDPVPAAVPAAVPVIVCVPVPVPVPALHTIPEDCIYTILLFCDSVCLSRFSHLNRYLTAVVNGEEDIWRQSGVNDFSLHLAKRKVIEITTSPRSTYLKYLQIRAVAKSNHIEEKRRQRKEREFYIQIIQRRLYFHLIQETGLIALTPALLCVFALLLLLCLEFPDQMHVDYAFIPLWVMMAFLTACTLTMFIFIHTPHTHTHSQFTHTDLQVHSDIRREHKHQPDSQGILFTLINSYATTAFTQCVSALQYCAFIAQLIVFNLKANGSIQRQISWGWCFSPIWAIIACMLFRIIYFDLQHHTVSSSSAQRHSHSHPSSTGRRGSSSSPSPSASSLSVSHASQSQSISYSAHSANSHYSRTMARRRRIRYWRSFLTDQLPFIALAASFFVLLTLYLDSSNHTPDTPSVSLGVCFAPVYVLELYLLYRVMLALLRDGLGWRCGPVGGRRRLYVLQDSFDFPLSLTLLVFCVSLILLMVFQALLSVEMEAEHWDWARSSRQGGGTGQGMALVPMVCALFAFSAVSVWSACTVYTVRINTCNRQIHDIKHARI